MANELPYLPDIFKDVVKRVSDVLIAKEDDPFSVFFDYGIYSAVSDNINKLNQLTYPLVWLVMKYIEKRGKDPSIYASVNCQLIIAMPTEATYSMQQITDKSFVPKLIPVYQELLNQIHQEKMFMTQSVESIEHERIDWPYWGGGEASGPGTPNLFKTYIDAISINNLALKVRYKKKNC